MKNQPSPAAILLNFPTTDNELLELADMIQELQDECYRSRDWKKARAEQDLLIIKLRNWAYGQVPETQAIVEAADAAHFAKHPPVKPEAHDPEAFSFYLKCHCAGIKQLPIAKRERESEVYKVIHKFEHEGVKYRINDSDGRYCFYATKYKCRYYHAVKFFDTLELARNFIFTSECP